MAEAPITFEGWKISQPFSGPDYEVSAPTGARFVLWALFNDDGGYDDAASVDRCRRFVALRMVRDAGMMAAPCLVNPCDGGADVATTLRSFLRNNRDDLGGAEIVDVLRALRSGETYQGGGGAAAPWTLRRALGV